MTIFSGYLWSAFRILGHTKSGENPTTKNYRSITQLILLVVLISHLFLLINEIKGGAETKFGLDTAILVIFWMATSFYWLFSFFYKLEILYSLIVFCSAAILPITTILPSNNLFSGSYPSIFGIHLVLSMMAYSIFTIAGLHTLLMAITQKHLNSGKIPHYIQSLPPLLTLEKILFQMIFVGIFLLSLSLITGMFFLEQTTGQVIEFNHKIVFGWLSWIIFICLITGRMLLGWRGRVAINCTIIGYTFLLLSYIGTRLVGEIILAT